MGNLRTIYGQFMENLWKSMENLWEIYGTSMGNLRTIYGQFMDNLWTIYGKSMGNPGSPGTYKVRPYENP